MGYVENASLISKGLFMCARGFQWGADWISGRTPSH